jgi:predicted dehydrogenase
MQKIKTALLAFGMSGRVFHAPFIAQHPGFEFAGACERSSKTLHAYYSKATSFPTIESVLEDSSVDLVIVNTPTSTHFEYAKRALEAGKHVVVEKAFTTHVDEAVELTALAHRLKRKLSVFHNRRWDSDFKTVQHVIETGALEKMVEVAFSYDRFKPALSAKLHKETPGPGAGVLMDLGPHLVDQVLVLFGMPSAVFGTLAIRRPYSQVDDFFESLLFYNDFIVRLRATYFAREPVPSYVVHGTKGSFLKCRADVQEAMLQAGNMPGGMEWGTEDEKDFGLLHTVEGNEVVRKRIPSFEGNYMEYYEGVYKALVFDKPMPVTAEEGIAVIRILEAIVKSNGLRKIIDL